MKTRTKLIAAAAAVAAVALLVWAFAPRPLEVELAEATLGRFETTVDEDARTRLRERYAIYAPLAGRLQRIAWREGDTVKEGDVLATLVPVLAPMLDARTRVEQQARVASARSNVQRAGTRIDAAKVALAQAQSELTRSEELAERDFVADAKVDADRLGLRAAQAELATAVQGERMARHDLAQAQAALEVTRAPAATAGGFAVRAPVAGRVLKVHQTSEATVALGAPLIDLGDTARLEIVAELLTSDALLARAGSEVRIERWGGPNDLQGRVRLVEPSGFTKISALGVEEQRVNVLIDITNPPAEWAALGDGYRVSVRIVTRSEAEALRVPVSAVFPMPSSRGAAGAGSAVFVFENGKAKLTAVTVGGRNGSLAWVQKGLQAGTKVIVYPPAGTADGVRVAERKV
jgi:HlyD family secretion protein